jgi:hypothetical protein
LFFLVAVVLYLPGIWWGMPYDAPLRARPWGWDELAPLQSVTEVWGVFFAKNPSFNRMPAHAEHGAGGTRAALHVGLWLTAAFDARPDLSVRFTDRRVLAMTTLLSRLRAC